MLTELRWYSFRSISSCIADEAENISWLNRVRPSDETFLGYVQYDPGSKDHNMLLAEKCLVKSKFFIKLCKRDMIMGNKYWEVYTTGDDAGYKAVKEVRKELYGGPTQVEIGSVNPSLMIRAFRETRSPRKKEWKQFDKSGAV